MLLRKLTAIGLIAIMLACAGPIQAVILTPGSDRRKGMPDSDDEGLQFEGEDSPEPFIIKPRPTPKAPAAYKPQPKPQPKPRPGANGTPKPGAPAPTPPITRPT
jgi:hypothetical protein